MSLFLLVLLLSSCSRELKRKSLQVKQQEIHFSAYHREYALKKYDRDSIKLPHPLQYIKAAYFATYVLNAKELAIYKSDGRNSASHTILFKTPLKREQATIFYQAISHINTDSIALQSAHASVDDGFQVEVNVIKAGKSTPFFWNNTYVPPLLNLLSLVNTLSPDSLKFYPVAEEQAFIQYLQKTSATH